MYSVVHYVFLLSPELRELRAFPDKSYLFIALSLLVFSSVLTIPR